MSFEKEEGRSKQKEVGGTYILVFLYSCVIVFYVF